MSAPAAPPRASRPRVRPRLFFLLGFAGLLAVGAILLRSPVPLLAALPLLVAPLSAAASRPPELGSVALRWEARGLGPELEVAGTLSGGLGSAASTILILPPPVPGGRLVRPPEYVRGPREISFTMAWTLHEPTITVLPPPLVVWRDPLGLLEHPLEGERPGLAIERYPPEVHRLGAIRLDRTLQLPGEVRSQRIGASGEFFGIREAAPDESPRQINWKASGRVGHLLANDFQIDRTGDILLLLDVRPSGLNAAVDEQLLGIARAGLFGIAGALLRGKVRVGFASFGEFVQAVPLSTGRIHRIRIERAVLSSQRSDIAAPPERCTFGLRRYFRPGLTTLLVSAWSGDPGGELLPYLRRSGFPSVLVSPSPLPLDRDPLERAPGEEETIVRRLEGAERRAHLAALWDHGPVIDWTDHWSLEPLVRFLRQPSRRRVA